VSDLFEPVLRSQTTGRAVEQHLKELIRARRLLAGHRLPPERQLAERLGVSRSTLRGALQSLAEQGVVTGRQGSGWTVQPSRGVVAANLAVYFSLEDVSFDELFAARRAVEPPIAAGAALHRSDAQVMALQQSIDAMRATSDPAAYLAADSDFHAMLASASENVLVAPVFSLLQDVRERLSGQDSVISASHGEHQRILDAVRRQDAEGAQQAMLDHIDRFVASGRRALRSGRPRVGPPVVPDRKKVS
jgi:DNA-binding FadR family transcriptional regulator